jgi:hypothetical protein
VIGWGDLPIPPRASTCELENVPTFILTHAHPSEECRVAAAAWKGFGSRLRHRRTLGSCATGGHRLWWTVEATDRGAALALLPPYVAERTRAEEVREVPIP